MREGERERGIEREILFERERETERKCVTELLESAREGRERGGRGGRHWESGSRERIKFFVVKIIVKAKSFFFFLLFNRLTKQVTTEEGESERERKREWEWD